MATIQLLFADEGNRAAMESIVEQRHTLVTDDQLRAADLYIVDEAIFPEYREGLETHKQAVEPIFCPVVLVRREQTAVSVDLQDMTDRDRPLLVDDVVRAPVRERALFRTLENLLARREQTERLIADLRERTAQLEAEHQKYQTLVEQSDNGIAVVQAGELVFVNERLTEILDRGAETLRNSPLERVLSEADSSLLERCREHRPESGESPTQHELTVRTPSGERKHIDLRSSRIEYEGEPASLLSFQDVTERKQRERELRQFKNAVEQAGHAIIVTDERGVIEYVNPAFEEITGYSAEEAVGLTPRILKSGEHGEELYSRLWETILDGRVWNTEIVNERKSGERFVALQTIAPIRDSDGDIDGFVGIQDEITDRRLREQQLEVFHRVLRHNLRNKGTVIMGNASMLAAELEDETARAQAETIQEHVQSLMDLSEKARHVRQVVTEAAEPQTDCDLGSFLKQTAGQFRSSYPDATLDLDIAPQADLTVDGRVRPALEELIENAVEHSDGPESRVVISLTTDQQKGIVTISDNGPGIPEQERRALEQGAERPLQHGSGLGLWLAYWLVHYVGGGIDIRVDGQGTSVSVELPLQ
ncbi:PAS domain S-box protein [Halovenus sp. WSH3]|uniref:PAS domain S-box protein n=1 Tax=Halovenus carboxidivorans TaxID=2692199 RepID=A0A6B0T690_9EURY|nr:PAS domain S-box protein [Halovenus carboxidivorans]MXR51706.1 PAS domain S-box protein [Halovenus carboxidivorans]